MAPSTSQHFSSQGLHQMSPPYWNTEVATTAPIPTSSLAQSPLIKCFIFLQASPVPQTQPSEKYMAKSCTGGQNMHSKISDKSYRVIQVYRSGTDASFCCVGDLRLARLSDWWTGFPFQTFRCGLCDRWSTTRIQSAEIWGSKCDTCIIIYHNIS